MTGPDRSVPDTRASAPASLPETERARHSTHLSAIASGGALNLGGAVASAILNFAIVTIITRGFGAKGAGTFFVALALFSLLSNTLELGADTGLVRTVAAFVALRRQRDLPGVIAVSVVPVLIAGLVAGVAIYVLAEPFARVFSSRPPGPVADLVRVFAFFLPFAAAYTVVVAATRGFGTMLPSFLIDRTAKPALQVLVVSLVVWAGWDASSLAIAWAGPIAAGFVVGMLALITLQRRAIRQARPPLEAPRSRWRLAVEFWRFTAPRGLAGMFQIAMVWIATLLIGALRSTGEAGIYTAATRYLLVGTFATVALSQVFGPKISELTALQDHDAAQAVYQGTTAWYVVLTWPLYLTLAIFAPFLVSIFGREFLPGADPLLILALTMLVATACGPVDVVLLMAGKSSWNLGNTVIALVINVGLSLLLIPRLGITGAAIAWAASILTNNLLPLAQSWRYLHLHPVGRGFPPCRRRRGGDVRVPGPAPACVARADGGGVRRLRGRRHDRLRVAPVALSRNPRRPLGARGVPRARESPGRGGRRGSTPTAEVLPTAGSPSRGREVVCIRPDVLGWADRCGGPAGGRSAAAVGGDRPKEAPNLFFRSPIGRRVPVRAGLCVLLAAAFVVSPRTDGAAQASVLFGSSAGQRGDESPRDAVERLESELGRKLAVVRVFKRWDAAFPTDYERWLRESGHTIFLSVAAQRLDGSVVPWNAIADAQPGSSIYDHLVSLANRVRGFGAQLYFSFDAEPETGNLGAMGSPADFVAAWQRVVSIFRDQGADNALHVPTFTAYTYGRTGSSGISAWYPGDEYVDALGADGYNFFGCSPGLNGNWREFAEIFDPVRQFGLAHPTKPIIVAEWGSVEDPGSPGRKAQWITGARSTLQSPGWEQFAGALYWHSQTPGCEIWADTSQSSIDALAAMGTDPYFYAGAPPVITSISPPYGRVGTTVTISGTDLGGVESVTFGGTTAAFSSGGRRRSPRPFHRARRPARSGSPPGSARPPARCSGSCTIGRSPSRSSTRPPWRWATISVADGFGGCLGNRTVKVQRKAPGSRWKTVIIPLTRADGSYRAHVVDRPGAYRALLKWETLSTGDVCARARSGVVH